MSNVSIERYDDFTGGLNLRADQFQLERNESPDMLNVEIDPRGGLFTRGAMREINTTDIGAGDWHPDKLFPFQGESPRLMLAANSRVYHSSGSNFTELQLSAGVPVTSSTTHGACMAQWGKYLYMTSGQSGNGGYVWNTASTYATALTASGVSPNAWQASPDPSAHKMPTAEHVLVHANKMFVADTTEASVRYPNRVRFSLEAIPDNWDEDDYFDFESGGDGITGLASVGGQLIVFKKNAIFVVYGYTRDDFQIVQLSAKLGAMSHDHIAVSETGVYFYSHPQGLHYYNGTNIFDVFTNLRPMYPEGYINSAADDKIYVSYVNRRVWVSLPFSRTSLESVPTWAFVFDPSIGDGSWVAFRSADGYAPVGGCDFTNSDGVTRHYMVHPTLKRVLQVDMYTEELDRINGQDVGFQSYYRTGWVDGRTYSTRKMWRRPDFVVKQVDTSRLVNVRVFHNFEEAPGNERKNFNLALPASSSGMLWGYGLWGQDNWGLVAQGAQVIKGSNLGLARAVQILFTGPVGGYWGIDSITYKYNDRKVTG
jgi:hypothetical protein